MVPIYKKVKIFTATDIFYLDSRCKKISTIIITSYQENQTLLISTQKGIFKVTYQDLE
jgi:hypothetical protein